MGVSYRQGKRIKERYTKRGASGLVHGGRGRISKRRIDVKTREQILRRYEERYLDFGPTFALEKLRDEGYAIHAETVRQWLLAAGLCQRQCRRNPYRKRRAQQQPFGERGGTYCLMIMVDDATKTTCAISREQETAEAHEVFAKGFAQDLNRRFSIPPIDSEDAHVRIPRTMDLRTIFCSASPRVVNNDWDVQYPCRYFQLLKQQRIRVFPGAKVTIAEWLDGSIPILSQKRKLDYLEITQQVLERARKGSVSALANSG